MIDFEQAIWQQQFEAYYQPIVDLDSGEIVTLEARVHWRDKRSGAQLATTDVHRAAAEADAHWEVDRAVLEQVAEALGMPRNQTHISTPIAVNISAASCASETSTARLEDFLAKTGLQPASLCLQFPLDAFQEHPSTVRSLAKRLTEKGYAITASDVDTADFKAANLHGTPLQAIKLSEKLVSESSENTASTGRVDAVCRAAKKRGLYVGAEGLVRIKQLEFLRRAGCHEGQGPLISRPRPLRELMFLLQKGRCW
ncbi:MAG: EAL domain-containing protein [Cellvibrionaceae bacterium]